LNSKSECCGKFVAYIVAILGTLLIVAVLVRVMIDYTRPAPLGEDRAKIRHKNIEDLRAANAEVLNNPNYVWQDQAKGIVRLPISQAMELSLKLWQDNNTKNAARSNLIARVEKANAAPPKAPEKPSQCE
jgi:hypothetical protein